MYVIRHPRKRKRLNKLYSEMCVRCSMEKINSLLPDLTDADLPQRRAMTTEVGAAIDGIALNSMFNPGSISQERRTELLKLVARRLSMLRSRHRARTRGYCRPVGPGTQARLRDGHDTH